MTWHYLTTILTWHYLSDDNVYVAGCVLSQICSKKVVEVDVGCINFFELCYIIEESKSLTYLECHALVNRTIKRFWNEKDFDKFFNRDITDKMTVPIEKNRTIKFASFNLDQYFFSFLILSSDYFFTIFSYYWETIKKMELITPLSYEFFKTKSLV